jgi:uncharacterized protein (TIGR03067 family)
MEIKLRKLGQWMLVPILLPVSAFAALDPGYQELQGAWQVVELVDNGRVVAPEAIPGWLPSGGRMEFVDNTIVFTAPKDGKRHARVFSIDATIYPRQFNLIDQNQISGQGIYQMDEGRLVVCLSPPRDTPRPTDFSARDGSRRVLMVLARQKQEPSAPATPAKAASTASVLNLPPPPAIPASLPASAKPLTNAEIGKLLPGNWKINDAYGAFYITLDKSGVFSTHRESVETSTFQKVFKKLPLSSGTWKLNNGQVMLTCTSSVFADRVYKSFPFTIRSVTATQLEFVDYAGNVGKAVRTQPSS